MVEGKPRMKQERRPGSKRSVGHITPERGVVSRYPSSSELWRINHTALSSQTPLRKKAKLHLRGPRGPTEALLDMTQFGNVEDEESRLASKQGSKEAELCPSGPRQTEVERPTVEVLKTQNIATALSSVIPYEQYNSGVRQPQEENKLRTPSTRGAKEMWRIRPFSSDGTVDGMSPPKARTQEKIGRAMILQAAMRVGAMVTEEEANEAAALFESPRRQRTGSSRSTLTLQTAPFSSNHLSEASKFAMKSTGKSAKGTIPTTPASAQRIDTPTQTLQASASTTLLLPALDTDSGYITQVSADESTRPIQPLFTASSQTLQDRLHRQREVEHVVHRLQRKEAKAARLKRLKLSNEYISDLDELARVFGLRALAKAGARPVAQDTNALLLDNGSTNDSRPLPSTRARNSFKKQLAVTQDGPGAKSAPIPVPVPVPEHWCICQQPSDEQDMLQCDGEYCLVGWFHRRCVGLAVMPEQDGMRRIPYPSFTRTADPAKLTRARTVVLSCLLARLACEPATPLFRLRRSSRLRVRL